MSYRQFFDSLSKVVRFSQAWLLSAMPRGGLQIVQPSHLDEGWIKSYSSEFHFEDGVAWRVIRENRTVCGDEVWPGGMDQSRFYGDFLSEAKLRYLFCAPVKSPVFPGYDGALHVFRTPEQGGFSEAEVQAITDAAGHIGTAAGESRASRLHSDCANPPPWTQRSSSRPIIFNSRLDSIMGDGLKSLDERVKEQILQDARHRLSHLGSNEITSDRIAVPDSSGQLGTFRAVVYRSYPALGEGPVVFYCQVPSFCEWISLRPADFSADVEVARLVPAIAFMHEHFRRGPTLGEIAKHVHLSPFHFHRRFTELLGITPKHFMLEAQIFYAKRLLFGQLAELAEIAKTCGFAHQSHFTSRFKQYTGLTPTRWRKLAIRSNEGVAVH